ncbi:hypothetical protein FACS1894196_3190 [Clostridia bacterium]|nr:hypothetical protein FACS1894196_3190 [Clostridia bacterium]
MYARILPQSFPYRSTALTLRLWDALRTVRPDPERARAAVRAQDGNRAAWEAEMRAIFGKTADTVIAAELAQFHKNDPARHAARLENIVRGWPQIVQIAREELPDTDDTIALMRELGMATTPGDLGISREDTRRALIGSREIRDKYITSSLLWDLGLLREMAETL